LAEDRLNRLNLFEAVVFALYGNWLISLLVDKISFSKFPASFNVFGEWYQAVCVGLAFFCLIILFAFSIFAPNSVRNWSVFVIYTGHVVGIYAAFSVEGWTRSNLVFFFIGLALFWTTFVIELRRIRLSRERVNAPPPT